jgi:DNA-binding MarR family transcriptional regulator
VSNTEIAFDQIPCNETALRKAMRRITQMYDAAIEPIGLTSGQLMILVEIGLRADNPPTMRLLAEALVMDRSALGHTLRPLERDGLLRFKQSKADRRAQHVILTRAGKAKMLAGQRVWARVQKRFEEAFGVSEAAELRHTLLRIARDERFSPIPA